jgi:hypothetical protein
MDYGKSGNPSTRKTAPRHVEHNARGTKKNPYGQQPPKAELVARMKAAAEAKKKG